MGASHVLIVDDDPLQSENIEDILTRSFETRVIMGQSVSEAEAALVYQIDFAFLDVEVADGVTYAFASQLAQKKIPFAFVSASDRGKMPAGLQWVPFVSKPYLDQDIVEVFKAAGPCTQP